MDARKRDGRAGWSSPRAASSRARWCCGKGAPPRRRAPRRRAPAARPAARAHHGGAAPDPTRAGGCARRWRPAPSAARWRSSRARRGHAVGRQHGAAVAPLGHEHHLVLADGRAACDDAHATWPWLGCGWSRGVGTPVDRARRYGRGAQVALWALWSAKWLVIARLAELGVNTLGLDTDMILQDDPYRCSRRRRSRATTRPAARGVARQPRLRLRARRGDGQRGGVCSVLADVVRRIRLFVEDWTLTDWRGAHLPGWDQGVHRRPGLGAARRARLPAHVVAGADRRGALGGARLARATRRPPGWPRCTRSRGRLPRGEGRGRGGGGGGGGEGEGLLHARALPAARGQPAARVYAPPGSCVRAAAALDPLAALAAPTRDRASCGLARPGGRALVARARDRRVALATPDWLYRLVPAGWSRRVGRRSAAPDVRRAAPGRGAQRLRRRVAHGRETAST